MCLSQFSGFLQSYCALAFQISSTLKPKLFQGIKCLPFRASNKKPITFKMKTNSTEVEGHYHRPNLFDDILTRLKELNVDLENVKRADISAVDEFHVRGAAVSLELAKAVHLEGSQVLDVGCGIGGPCRMLADEFNCTTTGIDISNEFINTAIKLSELVDLSSKTKFVQGDATNLPFADGSFDAVWTQHVQMNISDKMEFYRQIARVLRDGGTFLYYDIFKKGNEEVKYPMPWAAEASISFLNPITQMEQILQGLGLRKEMVRDQTENGIVFFENLLDKTSQSGPPKLGLNLLMGASTKSKLSNLLSALKEEKVVLQSGVYRK